MQPHACRTGDAHAPQKAAGVGLQAWSPGRMGARRAARPSWACSRRQPAWPRAQPAEGRAALEHLRHAALLPSPHVHKGGGPIARMHTRKSSMQSMPATHAECNALPNALRCATSSSRRACMTWGQPFCYRRAASPDAAVQYVVEALQGRRADLAAPRLHAAPLQREAERVAARVAREPQVLLIPACQTSLRNLHTL